MEVEDSRHRLTADQIVLSAGALGPRHGRKPTNTASVKLSDTVIHNNA